MKGIIPMTLGNKLKQLRGKRTQGEIANQLNISRPTYSHLETNRIEPSMSLLTAIADLYCVTTDYLLGRSQDSRLTATEDKKRLKWHHVLLNWYPIYQKTSKKMRGNKR